MSELARKEVTLCRKGTPPLTVAEYTELLPELPRWHIREEDGIAKLVRTYHFDSFDELCDFQAFLKAMFDEANHHAFLLGQDRDSTVIWWTHSIGGLHLNDFIMAARCDEVYDGRPG